MPWGGAQRSKRGLQKSPGEPTKQREASHEGKNTPQKNTHAHQQHHPASISYINIKYYLDVRVVLLRWLAPKKRATHQHKRQHGTTRVPRSHVFTREMHAEAPEDCRTRAQHRGVFDPVLCLLSASKNTFFKHSHDRPGASAAIPCNSRLARAKSETKAGGGPFEASLPHKHNGNRARRKAHCWLRTCGCGPSQRVLRARCQLATVGQKKQHDNINDCDINPTKLRSAMDDCEHTDM